MKTRTLVLIGMIVAAAASRLLPHWPNFTPITAMALFGAAYFQSRWTAFAVPLLALFISDAALAVLIHSHSLSGWLAGGTGFYSDMWVIYGTMVLITALGLLLRRKKTVLTVGVTTLSASVLFFVITNFACWPSMYEHTPAGLLACYTAALPFFQWTLLGDLCYVTILFGGFALAEKFYPTLQPAMA
ncbi:MAG TPA: DUF6580 family putative transport protein [Gemmataceae bacterium]|nr:DUF6580 family putative transport protein [Gemmataceae bacterium]